jgi:membrane glycosyltransferase
MSEITISRLPDAGDNRRLGSELQTPKSQVSACQHTETDSESVDIRHQTTQEWPSQSSQFVMPKIRRVSIVPTRLTIGLLRQFWHKMSRHSVDTGKISSAADGTQSADASIHQGWHRSATRRRVALGLVVLAQTLVACWSLARTFPNPELSALQIAIEANFFILFSWISFSFWSNVAGFCMLWRGRHVCHLAEAAQQLADRPLHSRTAVVMPICNEDVSHCCAAIEAAYRSLGKSDELDHFDFFLLSDTADAERQVEEEIAWAKSCGEVNGFGRIFYRHRRINIKRKSGNIADFLRRWSANYDFMVVLDADSVMSGESLLQLARLMEHYPKIGIIQTTPSIVNGQSMFARAQQFASRCYGTLFSTSLGFWQLGETYYWGHNAILRVAPFVKNCGLARLPGAPPLGGEIMSHDFVEAALIGRAGWEVWLALGLSGSYEESPPSVLDELKRDRRWCQGNLQHLRLWLSEGIKGGHRAILLMGVMAYASALFWLSFMILNTFELARQSLFPPDYFSQQPSLFPIWPEWHPEWALALIGTTALLLLIPKFFSFLLILKNREQPLYGGALCLGASIVLEVVLSTLLAPIRMWFHSKFVVLTLLGRQINWKAQCRAENFIGWIEAIRAHGFSALFAGAWIALVYWINPAGLYWLLPITAALILSIPLSVYLSKPSLGRVAKRWGLFQIPEEKIQPPIVTAARNIYQRRRAQDFPGGGFVQAVMSPWANRLHVELLRRRTPKSPEEQNRNKILCLTVRQNGPTCLSSVEKAYLLKDAASMTMLHRDLYRNGALAAPLQWQANDPDATDTNGFAGLI